jgi:PAS domain S-box-containing protein
MTPTDLASAIFGTWFEVSGDGAFAIDRDSDLILCASSRFAKTLGVTAETLLGRALSSYLPADAPHPLHQSVRHHDDVEFVHSDGGIVHLTLTAASVTSPAGEALIACTVRDTGARHRRHRELEASHAALSTAHEDLERVVGDLTDAKLQLEDRNHEIAVLAGQVSRFGWRAAVGELVAGIAHHLNNPVGALTSTLRRLETKVVEVPDPHLRGALQQLVQRSREIGTRIERNVHAVVRTHEAGSADTTCQWLALPGEIENALSMFADRLQHVIVIRDYHGDIPAHVPLDSFHLVLANLIDNSLRAMGRTGTLTISLRQRNAELVLQITDTGGGVPSDIAPRLFDPILSARPGGAGLGLSTAQRLARAWGGDVSYVPTRRGSTFEISIPIRERTTCVEDAAPSSPSPPPPLLPRPQTAGLAGDRFTRSAALLQEPNEDPS